MRKPQVSGLSSSSSVGMWISALALAFFMLLPSSTFAQKKQVSGHVYDQSGQPLVGAMVTVAGSKVGAYTDFEGKFLVEAAEGATLNFSFIGFEEKTAPAKEGMSVTLAEVANALDELVVVGYGTQKKSDLTGSVSSLSQRAFIDQPVSAGISILTGRVAGVAVRDGRIRVRGMTSINGNNDPLIVVDGHYGGMPQADEIVSLEVLKDASSAAIYGSRGANGVIIVTTKRGEEGKPSIKATADISVKKIMKTYDVMNAYDVAKFNTDNNLYRFTDDKLAYFAEHPKGTDWYDEIFQTSINQNYRIEISGGSKNVKYYIRPTFNKGKSNIIGGRSYGVGLNAKVDVQLAKWIKTSFDLSGGHSESHGSRGAKGSQTDGAFLAASLWSPTETPFDEDGRYTQMGAGSGTLRNPILMAKGYDSNPFSNYFSGILNVDVNIAKGLTFKTMATASFSSGGERRYNTMEYTNASGIASLSNSESLSWLWNAYLNYEHKFGKKHNFSAMAGFEGTQSKGESNYIDAYSITNDADRWYNVALSMPNVGIGSGFSNSAMASFFGRLNYNFDSRYYLTVNFRADGSSSYQPGRKWGYFPSFSAAWRLSEEPFMKNQTVFQNIKFRGGWGRIGNPMGGYMTYAGMRSGSFSWGDYTYLAKGYWPEHGGNPLLKWETTDQLDLGIDLSFCNRFTLTFDYYNKKTIDLLSQIAVPSYAAGVQQKGSNAVWGNVGSVRNQGFEANLDVVVVNKKNFSYDFNINASINRNKILDLGENNYSPRGRTASMLGSDTPFYLIEGEPIGTLYMYKYLGIWQENEAEEAQKYGCLPGMYKYEDVDKNGKIDTGDRQVLGNVNPKFNMGFNNHFSWKGLDVNILFDGLFGRKMFNATRYSYCEMGLTKLIMLKEATDVWTPENTKAKFGKTAGTRGCMPMSDQYVENANYIKLRNISIAYKFPRKIIPFADVQISASAQNLWTITNYKGLDPEIHTDETGTEGTDSNAGMDWFMAPNPAYFSFGISIKY